MYIGYFGIVVVHGMYLLVKIQLGRCSAAKSAQTELAQDAGGFTAEPSKHTYSTCLIDYRCLQLKHRCKLTNCMHKVQ